MRNHCSLARKSGWLGTLNKIKDQQSTGETASFHRAVNDQTWDPSPVTCYRELLCDFPPPYQYLTPFWMVVFFFILFRSMLFLVVSFILSQVKTL